MEPVSKRRKIDNDELESLVEQGENDKVKSIIQNANNASNPDDSFGVNWLHLAVKHRNLDLLDFLLTLDCDVNAKDSYGSTPLLLAASCDNFEAVQRLLDTDADVCVNNASGRSTFEILMDKEKTVSAELIHKCLRRFDVSSVDFQTKAEILVRADCSLELVLSLKDVEVTQAVLERKDVIDDLESKKIVMLAMDSLDVDNVRALLHHGPGTRFRKEWFINNLLYVGIGPQPNLVVFEAFIRVLVDLNIADQGNIDLFGQMICMKGNEEAVRILLHDDIDVYLSDSFACHLAPYIVHNKNVNAIELLKGRYFDVNAQDSFGFSALHWSLFSNWRKTMQYLLDLGADPDVKSVHGHIAITNRQVWKKKYFGKLLLQYGADVQAVDNFKQTVFAVAGYKNILSSLLKISTWIST